MEEVKVLDITSSLSIDVVRKNIKNMHLAVYPPTGRVRIAAPTSVDDEAVRLFAISKISWIRKNQRSFKTQDRQTQREFKERESHYFLGRRYLLRIIEEEGPAKIIFRTKTYIDLYIRPNSTTEQRQHVLNEWYRAELKKLIPPILEKWQKEIGVQVIEWQVKLMKTKWGSCNIEKQRILLNLELAKKPIQCLEYIIVHELIHLLERHHNDRFQAKLQKHLPNWQFHKIQLNRLPASHVDWDY